MSKIMRQINQSYFEFFTLIGLRGLRGIKSKNGVSSIESVIFFLWNYYWNDYTNYFELKVS